MNNFSIKSGGQVYSLENETDIQWETRPGGWLIGHLELPNGETKKIRAIYFEEKGKFWGQIGGTSISGEMILTHPGEKVDDRGDSDLIAQFPGKVRKVLVQEGQNVKTGSPLLSVEAMKMEFIIKAPYSGKVSRIFVEENQQISPGLRFAEIDSGDSQ